MDTLEREFAAARARLEAFRMTTRRDRGFSILESRGSSRRVARMTRSWARWVCFVKAANADPMVTDRAQWTLHARANRRVDLQAWYHSTFAAELYRLRGAFWWKEAVLPEYASHPIGDAAAAPGAEPAEGADKILCSPNTIYTAMAATMYTIRSTLGEHEYELFERLTTAGVSPLTASPPPNPASFFVIVCPR